MKEEKEDMSLQVLHVVQESALNIEQLRKDAGGFVYSELDYMCDREILLEDVNDLIEDAKFVKHAYFSDEKAEVIDDFETAISGNGLYWLEDVFFYPAEGDELSDPTESGEDELIFEIRECFKFGRVICEDAGTGELEEKEYNKIVRDKDGFVHGVRLWSPGSIPTTEQRKAAKWGGLEEYTNI